MSTPLLYGSVEHVELVPAGLHHDFHDNLYVLLRGRKRLRLFPPSMAACMHTHGRLRRVHGNGRIVYHEQVQAFASQLGPWNAA